MSKDLYLSKESYVAALVRIRAILAESKELIYFDDTTPGQKDTQCSWGLCWASKEYWPDSNDYLWPDQPDRVAVKYRRENARCPMDTRALGGDPLNGCFWSCRVFQKTLATPTREETLELYSLRIAEAGAYNG